MEFFANLDPEVKAAALVLVFYVADFIATKTANPFDNLIVRYFKNKK